MDLPIKFPTDVEVIDEDVARFRALTPEQRVREIGELCTVYGFLAANAERPEVIARLALADEKRGREAIEEFIARHGL